MVLHSSELLTSSFEVDNTAHSRERFNDSHRVYKGYMYGLHDGASAAGIGRG